jgi:hypothetical protein
LISVDRPDTGDSFVDVPAGAKALEIEVAVNSPSRKGGNSDSYCGRGPAPGITSRAAMSIVGAIKLAVGRKSARTCDSGISSALA